MTRWEDEDQYLTYMAKVMARLNRDDPPPTPEEELRRYTRDHWVDILCESISEADADWHHKMHQAYSNDDHLAMGDMVFDRIQEYAHSCAIAWGIIDE